MGLKEHTTYTLTCDRCHTELGEFDDDSRAEKKAEEAGWKWLNDKDEWVCPKCFAKIPKEALPLTKEQELGLVKAKDAFGLSWDEVHALMAEPSPIVERRPYAVFALEDLRRLKLAQ